MGQSCVLRKKNLQEIWLLCRWRSVYRGRDSDLGYISNYGNQSLGCQREKLSSKNCEVRVPMPRTGADRFVVATKVGNTTGVKGSN